MPPTRWDQRFFCQHPRTGVTLLRDGHTTVEDLARALNLTDNAVRTHLSRSRARWSRCPERAAPGGGETGPHLRPDPRCGAPFP